MAGQVAFDRKVFAHALDRIVTDPKFSRDVNRRPAETLKEIGIALPNEAMEALKGRDSS